MSAADEKLRLQSLLAPNARTKNDRRLVGRPSIAIQEICTVRVFTTAAVTGAIFSTIPAVADDKLVARETYAMNNLQAEMTTCANYFLLMERCVTNTPGTGDTGRKYGDLANNTIMGAMQIGETIGMTSDAMKSRMKAEGDALMKMVDGNCVNISSAMSRHMNRCEVVVSKPKEIIEEYRGRHGR